VALTVSLGLSGFTIGTRAGYEAWWLWALGAASLNLLVFLYENVMYTRAFTECTPVGIRTRGLAGIRQCPWRQVRDISCQRRGGGTNVIVTTIDGTRFRLGAPVDRISMRDPDFAPRVAQIRNCWRSVQDDAEQVS
jgi:hypothetical protein